jgi:hypothetical protein
MVTHRRHSKPRRSSFRAGWTIFLCKQAAGNNSGALLLTTFWLMLSAATNGLPRSPGFAPCAGQPERGGSKSALRLVAREALQRLSGAAKKPALECFTVPDKAPPFRDDASGAHGNLRLTVTFASRNGLLGFETWARSVSNLVAFFCRTGFEFRGTRGDAL